MRRAFFLVLMLVLTQVTPQGAGAQEQPAAPRTISVDELSAGMRGYGLTVLKGDTAQRFDVEIIDVLRGIAPGRNAVIIRASGLGLEQSGIIAGMSGSPVYVGNRLVGAVAFGWPWPKEAICGVTPIGEMEEALEAEMPAAAPAASWQDFDLAEILDLREPVRSLVTGRWERASPGGLGQLVVPLVVPMLTPKARQVMEAIFPPDRFVLAEGAASAPDVGAPASPVAFEPGGSLFAALVTGDMTMGAIGTVTDVRGDRLYGLGHPFLNQDDIELAMFTARVHTVFPSSFKSFKIGSPVQLAGTITRDRATGILGVVGKEARTLPMTVSIEHQGKSTTFRYQLFKHHIITGDLAAAVAVESLTALGDVPPESTLSYDILVDYSGGRNLDFKWRTAGRDALSAAARDLATLLKITMWNPLEKLNPETLELKVKADPADQTAVIESAAVRETQVRPGEVVTVLVTLKPALAPRATVKIELPVPANAPAGDKTLVVCDGRTSDALDLQEARHLLTPTDIEQLFGIITPRRDAGDIVARLADTDRGVALGSVAFPNLPTSTLAILASPGNGYLSPVYHSVTASTGTPYVITGKAVMPIRITNRPER